MSIKKIRLFNVITLMSNQVRGYQEKFKTLIMDLFVPLFVAKTSMRRYCSFRTNRR